MEGRDVFVITATLTMESARRFVQPSSWTFTIALVAHSTASRICSDGYKFKLNPEHQTLDSKTASSSSNQSPPHRSLLSSEILHPRHFQVCLYFITNLIMAAHIALLSLAFASSASALMLRGDIGTVCKAPQGSGICGSTVKADCNGYYVPGYCPGDNTIQCCIKATNTACSTPDGNGICGRTEKNDCNGFYTAGYCPGDKHFQCCVPSPDPPAEIPEGDDSTEDQVSSEDAVAADLQESLNIDLDATIAANNTIIGDDIELEDETDPLVARAAKLTRGDLIVKAAEKWLGKKYVFGGGDCSGPTKGGFDCSGLVLHAVCKVTKKKLPHNAQAQYNLKKGKHVKLSQIRPGDALFWATGKKCSSKTHHVGIYVGKDKKGKRIVLHAPHTGTVVKKAPVWTSELCGSAVRFW